MEDMMENQQTKKARRIMYFKDKETGLIIRTWFDPDTGKLKTEVQNPKTGEFKPIESPESATA